MPLTAGKAREARDGNDQPGESEPGRASDSPEAAFGSPEFKVETFLHLEVWLNVTSPSPHLSLTAMSGDAQKPNYGDFLSLEARTRARSAIKQLRPYFEIPGMISVSLPAPR